MEHQNIPLLRELKGPILVTGAAGLIGSAIIWKLNQMGFDNIVACDRLSGDKWRNLVPLKFRDYIEADCLLKNMVAGNRICDFDMVFHMGARSATDTVDCKELYTWNYDFSVKLLGWCRSRSHKARFVYASSAATLGNDAFGQSDAVEHLHFLRPTSLYGWFKHRFDLYVNSLGWSEVCALKFFNVYGPNEYHKSQQSMVFRSVKDLASGRLTAYNNRNKVLSPDPLGRDFIYVKDAADAAVHLARYGGTGIYSIGRGHLENWGFLAQTICHELGEDFSKIQDLPIEASAMLSELTGYQARTRANFSRLIKTRWEFGFPDLDQGVRDCLQYVKTGRRLGEEPSNKEESHE